MRLSNDIWHWHLTIWPLIFSHTESQKKGKVTEISSLWATWFGFPFHEISWPQKFHQAKDTRRISKRWILYNYNRRWTLRHCRSTRDLAEFDSFFVACVAVFHKWKGPKFLYWHDRHFSAPCTRKNSKMPPMWARHALASVRLQLTTRHPEDCFRLGGKAHVENRPARTMD